jgi:hypothetical protein
MKFSWKIYTGLGIVFVLSIAVTIWLPISELFRFIISFPAMIALIGAVYQIFRDQSAFEKQLFFQHSQHQFTLGAASHMANVAFDKHVEFCEKYISEMHNSVSTLFTEGPTISALDHASSLHKIQQEYTTWLTPNITENIDKFEKALRSIGANAGLVEATTETGDKSRGPAINEMYEVFKDVLDIKGDESRPLNQEVAVSTIIDKLRAVLGIEKLTVLRQNLIEKSFNTMQN